MAVRLTPLRRRLPALAVAGLALALGGVSVVYGVKTAEGSDSFGYVSQAYLWRDGTLAVRTPVMEFDFLAGPQQFVTPLAYVPGGEPNTLAPTYPPGLPLLMAGGLAVFGTWGPFLVIPVCAALLIVSTFALGRRFDSAGVGVVAAALVAVSPAVIYQSMWPMSDVPVAAAWTSCLVAARGGRPGGAIVAGALAGLAILIRPNLAPLAAFGAALLWQHRRGLRAWAGMAVLYGLAAAPALIVLLWFNTHVYGSPFRSGYGDVGQLYNWSSTVPNLANYSSWFAASQGLVPAMLVLAAWVRALLDRGLRPLALFAAAVVACYLPYLVFEEWWYLRFLLPAYPALAVIAVSSAGALLRTATPGLRRVLAAAVLALAIGQSVWSLTAHNPFTMHKGAQRYATIGTYVRRALPPNAAFLTMQHSGSLRYYSGRLTVRYDWLQAGQLPFARGALEEAGYEVYVLIDDGEEDALRRRFTFRGETEFLDRPPQFELLSAPRVRIYKLSDDGAQPPPFTSYIRPGRSVPIAPVHRPPHLWEPPAVR